MKMHDTEVLTPQLTFNSYISRFSWQMAPRNQLSYSCAMKLANCLVGVVVGMGAMGVEIEMQLCFSYLLFSWYIVKKVRRKKERKLEYAVIILWVHYNQTLWSSQFLMSVSHETSISGWRIILHSGSLVSSNKLVLASGNSILVKIFSDPNMKYKSLLLLLHFWLHTGKTACRNLAIFTKFFFWLLAIENLKNHLNNFQIFGKTLPFSFELGKGTLAFRFFHLVRFRIGI
jgi:hypothetical protein